MMIMGSRSKLVKSPTATTSVMTTMLLWIGRSSMTTTILCCLCMMISMSCDDVLLMYSVAAADDEQPQVVGEYDNFQDYDSYCNNGPDALTEESGKSIPRTCFDVPYNSEKDNNEENAATTKMERCYYTYVPESCTTDSKSAENYNGETAVLNLPVVFDIHGLLSCPLWSTRYTGWLEKAQEECFVVVWPIGNTEQSATPGCWNLPGFLTAENRTENDVTTPPCCCFEGMDPDSALPVIPTEEPNDPLFLRMVIDSVVEAFQNDNKTIATTTTQTTTNTTTTTETQNDEVSNNTTAITTTAKVTIDRSRVYMSGHSNGCMTSLTMAALYSDSVAAVCCHAGSLITPFPASASTTGTYIPVPVWMVHGMQDTVIPYEGTTLVDMAPFGSIGFWSTQDLVKYIAKKNECHNQEEYSDEEDDTTGNSTTFFYTSNNCTNNATVELVMMSAVGHVPYIQNSNPEVPIFEQGGANELSRVDTTALAWEFCSSHHNSYQRALQQQDYQNDEKEATEEDPITSSSISSSGDDSIATDVEKEDGAGEGNSNVLSGGDGTVAGNGEKQDDSTSSSSAESSSSSSSTYSVAVELSSIFIIIMTMAV